MREVVQFLDQIETPNDIGLLRALVGFVLHAFVLALGESVGRGADDFAAVAAIVNALPFDDGRGADAFARPIVYATGFQFVVNGLPEKLAVFLVEAHQDALIALDLGVLRVLVIGADEDFAVGDDRAAVSLGAKVSHPFDILLAAHLDAPLGGYIAFPRIDHIAGN